MPLPFAPRWKAGGRKEGKKGQGSEPGIWQNQPLSVSPFTTITQHSGQGEKGREEQLKGSVGDVGWHIRNLLELDIWAGPWQGSRELLIIQSFKICTTDGQEITPVWGQGMFSPAPACETNKKMGRGGEIPAVNCLNKHLLNNICSGNTPSCCLFSRDCPGQVPDSTAGSWQGTGVWLGASAWAQ